MVKSNYGILEIDPIDQREENIEPKKECSETEKLNKLLIDCLSGLTNYWEFLNGFLKFCSTFDYEHHTISLRNGGMFLERKPIETDDEEDYQDISTCLSVENFQDKYIDIGQSCYNFIRIRELFQKSLILIKQAIASNDKSILSSLAL